jgi:hypothetical protein
VERGKDARVSDLVSLLGTLLETVPTAIQAALGPVVSQLPLSVCNLICTNVPGPQEPLYLLGHRLLACYPYVPIGGEMGMNCAFLSYAGTGYFGLTGDACAIPNLDRLAKLLRTSFGELRQAVAGKEGRIGRPQRKAPEPEREAQKTMGAAAGNNM